MRVWTILACGKICWRIAELCWSNGNKNNNMISKETFCKVIALMQEQDQVIMVMTGTTGHTTAMRVPSTKNTSLAMQILCSRWTLWYWSLAMV